MSLFDEIDRAGGITAYYERPDEMLNAQFDMANDAFQKKLYMNDVLAAEEERDPWKKMSFEQKLADPNSPLYTREAAAPPRIWEGGYQPDADDPWPARNAPVLTDAAKMTMKNALDLKQADNRDYSGANAIRESDSKRQALVDMYDSELKNNPMPDQKLLANLRGQIMAISGIGGPAGAPTPPPGGSSAAPPKGMDRIAFSRWATAQLGRTPKNLDELYGDYLQGRN